jgi:hypothetical protein
VWYTAVHMRAKKTTLNELGDMLTHVVKHMATKDDIAAITGMQNDHAKTLADHTKTLADHTRDLNIIKRDVETNLDKRLELEVRVDKLEKKVFGAHR